MAARYLYFVRHGQFDPDEKTNPGGGLTAIGRRQARAVAKAFQPIPLTAIHVSALPRAIQTAEPLVKAFPGVKVSYTHRLMECIPPLMPELREQFFKDVPEEDLRRHYWHAERAFAHYVRRTTGADKHEVLIGHGNLIRYLVCRTMDVDATAWAAMTSINGGITRIVVESNGLCSLISYNDLGHLPVALHTDNLYVGFNGRPPAPERSSG
jgi:serine/threonine-protein phosphatase PGAM5